MITSLCDVMNVDGSVVPLAISETPNTVSVLQENGLCKEHSAKKIILHNYIKYKKFQVAFDFFSILRYGSDIHRYPA